MTVDPSQLRFSPGGGWQVAQRVEVEVESDLDAEQDGSITLKHTVRGSDYEGVYRDERAGDVEVSIRELHKKGINVEATPASPSELSVREGEFNTYDVWLNSQPTGTVTVTVGFQGASGDVTVNPSRLTFTTSNWRIPQDVEVSAAEDVDAEQDAAVTLRHSASGGGYDNVTGGMITVTIAENSEQVRTKGVTVSPKSLTVMEGGPSRSYTVVLTAEPNERVLITIGGLVLAREQSLDVTPTTLSFTPNNWDVPRSVTVRADEDANATGHDGVMLTHTPTGGGYDGITVDPVGGITVDPVSVTIRDNDTHGITVDPTSLEIAEGERESFTVVLDAEPENPVTVTVETTAADLTLSPLVNDELTFDSGNWDQPQTVWASAAEDSADIGDDLTIDISATGYEPRKVTVVIRDTDAKGVVVSPASLRITEGTSKTYSLVLTHEAVGQGEYIRVWSIGRRKGK